mgnify:CR=1 FL=1
MLTRDQIVELRTLSDKKAEEYLQCQGEFHPDFHEVSDEFFAKAIRTNTLIEAAETCNEAICACCYSESEQEISNYIASTISALIKEEK